MIYIDPREGSGYLLDLDWGAIQVTRRTLDYGDAMFHGKGPGDKPLSVGIEMKAVSDLVQSRQQGRLQGHDDGQLPGLLESYDVPALLVIGRYRENPATGRLETNTTGRRWLPLHREDQTDCHTIDTFLFECQLSGIVVHRVETELAAAQWLASTYDVLQKPWNQHKQFRVMNDSAWLTARRKLTSLFPKVSRDSAFLRRMKFAMIVPGVSFERAAVAALHFTSLLDMVTATQDELTSLQGFGKGVAGNWHICMTEIRKIEG